MGSAWGDETGPTIRGTSSSSMLPMAVFTPNGDLPVDLEPGRCEKLCKHPSSSSSEGARASAAKQLVGAEEDAMGGQVGNAASVQPLHGKKATGLPVKSKEKAPLAGRAESQPPLRPSRRDRVALILL